MSHTDWEYLKPDEVPKSFLQAPEAHFCVGILDEKHDRAGFVLLDKDKQTLCFWPLDLAAMEGVLVRLAEMRTALMSNPEGGH